MGSVVVDIISAQTDILLHNVGTMIRTCDMEAEICGMPVWKHVYHALHSLDQWFVNPDRYEEPPFHMPGLNSLDISSDTALSADMLIEYFDSIKAKLGRYLAGLTDEELAQRPEGCPHARLALILGQYRHLYAHLGIVNGSTILATGRWPRVVGMDGDFSKGLYE